MKEAAGARIRFPEGRLAIGQSKLRQADGFGFQQEAPVSTAARRGGQTAADLTGLHCGDPPGAAPDVRAAVFHRPNLLSDARPDKV